MDISVHAACLAILCELTTGPRACQQSQCSSFFRSPRLDEHARFAVLRPLQTSRHTRPSLSTQRLSVLHFCAIRMRPHHLFYSNGFVHCSVSSAGHSAYHLRCHSDFMLAESNANAAHNAAHLSHDPTHSSHDPAVHHSCVDSHHSFCLPTWPLGANAHRDVFIAHAQTIMLRQRRAGIYLVNQLHANNPMPAPQTRATTLTPASIGPISISPPPPRRRN